MCGKLKICLITPPFLPVPAVKGGGRETLIELLAKENEKSRLLDLHIISPFDEKAKAISGSYLHSRFYYLTNGGSAVYKKLSWKFCRAYQRYIQPDIILNPYYKEVAKLLSCTKFDLVIDEAGPHPDLRGISRIVGLPRIGVHLHCVAEPNRELRDVSGFSISVSEFVRNKWTSPTADGGNNYVVCNGIDASLFPAPPSDSEREAIRGSFGFNETDFVVLYCGRIAPEKGLLHLIRSIEEIQDDRVKLLIAGERDQHSDPASKYYNEVMDHIRSDEHRYKYLGYIDNSKLKNVYGASDIQVIPTMCEEAAGLVAIEGMLSGLPQIVSDSGGLVEYVDDSCSVIVARGEGFIDDLSKAVMKLLEDDGLRASMSKFAAMRGQQFSSELFYWKFCRVLESRMTSLDGYIDGRRN